MSDETITIQWDGDPIPARPGDPIAVSLYRAGIKTQTRSIKYHRARGPQCFTGDCPGCMVRVDGIPNVRGCQTTSKEGVRVESQIGRPNAKHDVLGIVDRLFDRFDHERRFVRPRIVREAYQAIARRLAGFGTQPTGTIQTTQGDHHEPDLFIAGGGPAGLAAAHAARQEGARVLIADEDGFGGQLHHTPRTVDAGPHGRREGPRLAQGLAPEPDERIDGTVIGIWDGTGAVLEETPEGWAIATVKPDRMVLANGASENAALIPGGDRPGVLSARAARILLNRYETPPGDPVVLLDPQREGCAFQRDAKDHGLAVRVVDDAIRITGDPTVTGVDTSQGHVQASAVVTDAGLTPAPELGRQAGIPYTYEGSLGGRVPLHRPDGSTPIPDVYIAGSAAGQHTPEAAIRFGHAAGTTAAGGHPGEDPEKLLNEMRFKDSEEAALRRVWRPG